MNYFAHGRDLVDMPYVLAGTALPDWLSVVDRKLRVRRRHAEGLPAESETASRDIAAGVLRHLHDDGWFHQTRAFAELSWQLASVCRQQLPDEEGLRPHFLGHILVEILLDATLIQAEPDRLHAYYAAVDGLNGQLIAATVDRMTGRQPERLAEFVPLFSRERFLWDYLDDAKLLFRLNQVMRRVGLSPLPADFGQLLPAARAAIGDRAHELLAEPEGPSATDSIESPVSIHPH